MNPKLKTVDIELAVVEYFNPRTNLIVPNISWGMFLHECDLLILTKNGCAYEVEIKTSAVDLKKDLEKKHMHNSSKIKKLYFAIPDYLLKYQDFIPERAGILTIGGKGDEPHCYKEREAQAWSKYTFTDKDRYQVARLGAMRIWGLKRKLNAKN